MFEGLLQPMHLLVIFGLALLVFGPKKLPELGKGLGDGIRGFRSAMKDKSKPEQTTTIATHQNGTEVNRSSRTKTSVGSCGTGAEDMEQ